MFFVQSYYSTFFEACWHIHKYLRTWPCWSYSKSNSYFFM